MRAIVQGEYGSPDRWSVGEVDRPGVGAKRVLVRVHAAAIHPGDQFLMRGRPYVMRLATGLRHPRHPVPGFDLAGVVEAVGEKVAGFRPGDEVFGEDTSSLADYAATKEHHLAPKPASLSFEQAAAVPVSALTALQGLRDRAALSPGHSVLVNGASGGVGTFAVQIAKALGAQVTAVCSGGNADLVRSLGADDVIDYEKDDFTRIGRQWDVVLDNVANHSLKDLRRAVKPGGILVPNNGSQGGPWFGPLGRMIGAVVQSPFVGIRQRTYLAVPNREDLDTLSDMIDGGDITPVIDSTYPLEKAAAAMRRLETGHARGKIVITIRG